jgi:ubiquinone/menaquinone biosynthesis C-methylase UbiE
MNNRNNKEKRFWKRFANYYDSFIDIFFRKTYKSILVNIDSELNISHNVLEVGTGTGIIAFSIYSKVSSIIATDISSEMIRIANKWSFKDFKSMLANNGLVISKALRVYC